MTESVPDRSAAGGWSTPARGRVSVRLADLDTPHDAALVIRLLDAYACDAMGDGEGLPECVREDLVPGLRGFPGASVLLAFVDDHPCGIAVCFQGFSTFRARRLLNIHDFAVLTAYRRRGVGAGLLTAVESLARQLGCCKVTLEVREDNGAALALYERAGFGAGRSGDRPVQHLFLEKRLS
jgi:ribosomal protein S18 acetylase RimI-like enzyme